MPDGNLHVVPCDDLLEHVLLRQCWCRPRVEEGVHEDLVIHNSADGREYSEPDHIPEAPDA